MNTKKEVKIPKIKILDNKKEFKKEIELSKPTTVVIFNKRTGLYKKISRTFAEAIVRADKTGCYKIQ